MRQACSILLSIFLATSWTNTAWAQNWTRFRGPDGTGQATAEAIPVGFTPEDHNWRIELPGPGHSSPVIWDRFVYVTCLDGETALTVVCLGTEDGNVLWKQEIEVEAYGQHRDNSFAAPTPTVDAGGVYLTFVSGGQRFAIAYGHDGRQRWRQTIGPFQSQHGSGASAVVVKGVVVVPNESEHADSSLTALDPATGEVRWRLARDGSGKGSFATPTVYRNPRGGVELICAGDAHGITSVDPERGTINWQLATNFRERCVGSPVVADGLIIQTAGSGGGGKEFVAVRPGSADAEGEAAIVYDELPRALPYVPTPIAVGKLLFLWADNGIVTCVKAATGEQVWQERVGGSTYSSPICVNGRLYNLSRDGKLHIIAARDRFEMQASIDLGEPTQASPAVAGGVLYLRTARHLISIGGKAK